MSEGASPKDKLAEALLRFESSSRRNYEVIPPAPGARYPVIASTSTSQDSYTSEEPREGRRAMPQVAQMGGYSWALNSSPLTAGYSAVPQTTAGGAPKFAGDYYLTSSSSTFGGRGLGEDAQDAQDPKIVARRLAERLARDLHLNRDFNKDYQTLTEAVELNNGDGDLAVLTALRLLTKEFLDTAQSVGSIIIDELFEHNKTIPPVNIGGIAGGVKYVYRNILYKICLDTDLDDHRGWMHGGNKPSHEKAMKTGAHELRGLMHYSSLRVSGLHFPLMLVMDYKGFRLVAEAILPINKETIRYGSSDGGETVHAQGDELCLMMRTVGQQLHLAPHIVKDKTLYGPGDQEVHLGLDNRYYCIDLARVFPCEPARHHMNPSPSTSSPSSTLARSHTPSSREARAKSPGATPVQEEPRSIFYKFFRPEFVLTYKKPLACDSFTAWGKHDPQFQQNNKDLIDAFHHLRAFTIPKYAQWLDKKVAALPRGSDPREFWKKEKPLEELHAQGINIRHLGLVRSHCVNEFAKKVLLNEMIARTVKNLIRKRLRDEMHAQTRLSNEQVKDIVIEFYNFALGKGGSPAPSAAMNTPATTSSSTEVIAAPQPVLRTSGPLLSSSGPIFALHQSSDSISSTSSSNGSASGCSTPVQALSAATPSSRAIPIVATSSPSLTGSVNTASPRPFQSSGLLASKLSALNQQTPSSPAHSEPPLPLLSSSSPLSISSSSASRMGSSLELDQSSDSTPQLQSTSSGSSFANAFPDLDVLDQFYFQFETSLTRDEMKDPVKTVSHNLDKKLLFFRLNQMLGIEMNLEAEKELHSTTSYEFVHCDISSIAPRVRFMNLVDEAEGLVLYSTAKQKKTEQRKRLLALATQKFQASCASLPHNFNGYFYWGRSLYEEGKAIYTDTARRIVLLEESLSKLELVSKLRPGHASAWIIQVKIWLKLFETKFYQDKIIDSNNDPLAEDFSFLTDKLSNAATRLVLLDIFWVEKLLRRAKVIFAQAQSRKGEPTSLLKIAQVLCVAIQTVSGPMLDAMPSVPLPPDAVQIKLPRLHVESLLLCARALLMRSNMASERASAAKPLQASLGAHQMGINQDELHSKRLKFQIAEQFIAALGTKFSEDSAYFDRLILDSLSEIFPLIKSSKNLSSAFQKRCREITKVQFNAPTVIRYKAPSNGDSVSPNPNRSSGSFSVASVSSQTATSSSAPTATSSPDSFQIFVDLALPHVGPKVTTIDLSGCKSMPIAVVNRLLMRSHLTLTSLDLSEVPSVTDIWLQTGLSQLQELRILNLRELKLTDETAVILCTQLGHKLEVLNVAGNRLTNLGLYRMSRELKKLAVLDLSGNNHLGAHVPPNTTYKTDFADALGNLRPTLISLSMLECYSMTNQAVWDIAMKLRHLKHLAIASKQITDQYLMKLEPLLPHLESLSLKGLSNSDTAFKHLFSHLGGTCTYLSLRACMGLSDESLVALDKCINLKTLHLGLCLQINGHSLVTLSQSIHSLTELDLSGLSIEPVSVAQIVSAQPNMAVLNLAAMENPLSDHLFISMVQCTPQLRELNLSSNTKITGRSVEALSKAAPRMESLSLSDCHGLTAIEGSLQRLKMLTYLNIRYAHPKQMHCLINPKLSHVKQLVICNCTDPKAFKPEETPNISKQLPELLAQHGLTKDKVLEASSSSSLSDDSLRSTRP